MSYYINGGGTVRVSAANLRKWDPEADVSVDLADSLRSELTWQGFTEVYITKDGDVEFGNYDGNVGDLDAFLADLAPAVDDGFLEFHGEDDSHWRYVFKGGVMHDESPTEVWPGDGSMAILHEDLGPILAAATNWADHQARQMEPGAAELFKLIERVRGAMK
jgi:hypothetical protein